MTSLAVSARVAKPQPRAPARATAASATGARTQRQASAQPSQAGAWPMFLGGRGAGAVTGPRFLADESLPIGAGRIQRQCACGAGTSGPGPCDECASQEDRLQPKLALSQPGDPYEQEADRAADAVLAGTAVPALSPLSAPTSAVQAKGDGGQASAGTHAAAQAVQSGGRPLDGGERAFFEPRFGRDLSAVRVHTDGHAGQAARGIDATAYTLDNHIAFAPGSYSPDTEGGQRLMAHELAHTLQQGRGAVIRRTCPAGEAAGPKKADLLFEVKVWAIRGLDSFRNLPDEGKAIAEHIIEGARGSACPMYYADKLQLLFTTTEKDKATMAAEGAATIETAKQVETTRVAEEKKKVAEGKVKEDTTQVEEKIADARAAHMVERLGQDGTKFYVDARDPNNIVVRIKVRLQAKGSGTEDDVKGIKALEDGIEKAAAVTGYTFDVVFVDDSGPDVFEAGVNTAEWTTSSNWVGDVETMAHESHHLLGLADRYNYIESHADNVGMSIHERLTWFREQMVRGPDPTSRRSMMASHSAFPFDDLDVCAVAYEKPDVAGCVAQRIQGKGMDELVQMGKTLSEHYEPQNAAMLRRLAVAWQSQCYDRYPEQRFDSTMSIGGKTIEKCWVNDCSKPPEDAFGRVYTIDAFFDQLRYPLANPHDQPAGDSLKRQSAPWWARTP